MKYSHKNSLSLTGPEINHGRPKKSIHIRTNSNALRAGYSLTSDHKAEFTQTREKLLNTSVQRTNYLDKVEPLTADLASRTHHIAFRPTFELGAQERDKDTVSKNQVN